MHKSNRLPGIVFGLIGLAMVASGLGMTLQRLLIWKTWSSAQATVVSSRVISEGTNHRADIVLRFEAAGQRILTRPATDYRSGNRAWIAGKVDRFPAGSMHTVHFDPRRPANVRLNVGANFDTIGLGALLIGFGIIFGGVGLLAHWNATKRDQEGGGRSAVRADFLGVGVFILVMAVGSIAGALLVIPRLRAEAKWPVVTARTLSHDISESRGINKRRFLGTATFAYAVDGRDFAVPLTIANWRSSRGSVERKLGRYPVGSEIEFRINPANPNDLRFIRGPLLHYLIPVVFGVVGVILGAVSVMLLRQVRRS